MYVTAAALSVFFWHLSCFSSLFMVKISDFFLISMFGFRFLCAITWFLLGDTTNVLFISMSPAHSHPLIMIKITSQVISLHQPNFCSFSFRHSFGGDRMHMARTEKPSFKLCAKIVSLFFYIAVHSKLNETVELRQIKDE